MILDEQYHIGGKMLLLEGVKADTGQVNRDNEARGLKENDFVLKIASIDPGQDKDDAKRSRSRSYTHVLNRGGLAVRSPADFVATSDASGVVE